MNKTQQKTLRLLILLALPLWLAGCTAIGETLGFDRSGPDEFNVATTPPLVMPPDFTLRPPAPGTEPEGIAASDQAKAALLGTSATAAGNAPASNGEAALLQQAGSAAPAPTVTAQDNAANTVATSRNKLMDTVLFGKPDAPTDTTPTITMSKGDGGGWFSWL